MNKTRYVLIIILLFCGNCLFGQSVPAWGGGADLKDISFGFSFSYVGSYLKIDKKPNWRNPYYTSEGNQVTDSAKSISSPNAPGFAVGFLMRYRITDHLEVRTTPSLIFADRYVNYTYNTPSENVQKSVQANMIDIPLSIKIKSDRISDFRPYLLAGLKYSQALGSKINSDVNAAPADKLLKNVSSYGSYEAGIGCDIYLEYFKLSPELKISNSIGNVLYPENQAFAAPISKLSLHTIMFSLYFE